MHQPEVDVSDKTTQIVVIAHLSGVKGEDIEVDIHGDIMTIEAARTVGSGRVDHYHRELLLPAEVHDTPVKVSFAEGLLEVRLRPKTKDEAQQELRNTEVNKNRDPKCPQETRRRRGTHGRRRQTGRTDHPGGRR